MQVPVVEVFQLCVFAVDRNLKVIGAVGHIHVTEQESIGAFERICQTVGVHPGCFQVGIELLVGRRIQPKDERIQRVISGPGRYRKQVLRQPVVRIRSEHDG